MLKKNYPSDWLSRGWQKAIEFLDLRVVSKKSWSNAFPNWPKRSANVVDHRKTKVDKPAVIIGIIGGWTNPIWKKYATVKLRRKYKLWNHHLEKLNVNFIGIYPDELTQLTPFQHPGGHPGSVWTAQYSSIFNWMKLCSSTPSENIFVQLGNLPFIGVNQVKIEKI